MTDSKNTPNGHAVDASGLRERLLQKPDAPQQASSAESAHEAVKELNTREANNGKDEKDKKTYGRTPDGTGEYFQCSPRHGVGRADGTAAATRTTVKSYLLVRQVNRKRKLPPKPTARARLQNLFLNPSNQQR